MGIPYKKRTIWERDSGRCHYCRVLIKDGRGTQDHVIAKAKGGTDHIDNLVLCCRPCNYEKSDMDAEEFKKRKQLPTFVWRKGSLNDPDEAPDEYYAWLEAKALV